MLKTASHVTFSVFCGYYYSVSCKRMAEDDTTRYADFDALMTRHRGLIKSLCWWYAGGQADRVADLMQEAMLALWHYRHTLRPDASAAQERQWVRLHCRSVFDHQRRRPVVETVPLEDTLGVAADDDRCAEMIDRLADGLSDREHRVLGLLLDGYTDGEMAAALRIGEAEAKRLHATVIEKMKRTAENNGD